MPLTTPKCRIMNYIHYTTGDPRFRNRSDRKQIAMGVTPVRFSDRASIFGLDEEQQAILDQADPSVARNSTRSASGWTATSVGPKRHFRESPPLAPLPSPCPRN